jgi:DNA-binding GntR family transcriptional regulator
MKQPTGLQTPADLEDKENFIWQSLMTAIVEHQLPPGSKLPEEAWPKCLALAARGSARS